MVEQRPPDVDRCVFDVTTNEPKKTVLLPAPHPSLYRVLVLTQREEQDLNAYYAELQRRQENAEDFSTLTVPVKSFVKATMSSGEPITQRKLLTALHVLTETHMPPTGAEGKVVGIWVTPAQSVRLGEFLQAIPPEQREAVGLKDCDIPPLDAPQVPTIQRMKTISAVEVMGRGSQYFKKFETTVEGGLPIDLYPDAVVLCLDEGETDFPAPVCITPTDEGRLTGGVEAKVAMYTMRRSDREFKASYPAWENVETQIDDVFHWDCQAECTGKAEYTASKEYVKANVSTEQTSSGCHLKVMMAEAKWVTVATLTTGFLFDNRYNYFVTTWHPFVQWMINTLYK